MKINKKLLLSLATGLLVCGAANAAKVTLTVPDGNPGGYCVGVQDYYATHTKPTKATKAGHLAHYTPSYLFPFQDDDRWTLYLSAKSFYVTPLLASGKCSPDATALTLTGYSAKHIFTGPTDITLNLSAGTATVTEATPTPTPTPTNPGEYKALTTNFTMVGTPTGGCGVPGASFSSKQDQSDPDSAFDMLEMNGDDKTYANNYVALNVEDTPIRYYGSSAASRLNNTRIVENNSIVSSKAFNQTIMAPRPMGYTNSTNGNNAHNATFVGDWNDGRNCGRWLKVDFYDNDGSTIWNKGLTGNGLPLSDNEPSGKDMLTTINPNNHTKVIATSNYIVDDSCQDAKTVCRGFDDQSHSLSSVPVDYYRHHIDLNSYSHVYLPGQTPGTDKPTALNTQYIGTDGKPKAKQSFGKGGANYYIHWHYEPNPTWDPKTDLPNLGILKDSNYQNIYLGVTHLRNGIHGLLYCLNFKFHSCTDSDGWKEAKMFNDGGQSFALSKMTPSAVGTMAIRIIDADGNEANHGVPYTFTLPKSGSATGKITSMIQQGGYLAKASSVCNYTPGRADSGCIHNGGARAVWTPVTDLKSDTPYDATAKQATVAFNPQTSITNANANANATYLGFENANLSSTSGGLGHFGKCDKTAGSGFTCQFYNVPDGTYNMTMTGNVDLTNKPSVRSEKQTLSGPVTISGEQGTAQLNITTTRYISYVPINIALLDSNGKSFTNRYKPQDTDLLNLELKANNSTTIPTTTFGAPTSLNVPFDNSEPNQMVMYQVNGNGDSEAAALTMSINGKTAHVGEGDKPTATSVKLFGRNLETVFNNIAFSGVPADFDLSQSSSPAIPLSFKGGVLQDYSSNNPVTVTFNETHPPFTGSVSFNLQGDADCDTKKLPGNIPVTIASNDGSTGTINIPKDGSESKPYSAFTGGFTISTPSQFLTPTLGNTICEARFPRTVILDSDKQNKKITINYHKQPPCEYTVAGVKHPTDLYAPQTTLTITDNRDKINADDASKNPNLAVTFTGTGFSDVWDNNGALQNDHDHQQPSGGTKATFNGLLGNSNVLQFAIQHKNPGILTSPATIRAVTINSSDPKVGTMTCKLDTSSPS